MQLIHLSGPASRRGLDEPVHDYYSSMWVCTTMCQGGAGGVVREVRCGRPCTTSPLTSDKLLEFSHVAVRSDSCDGTEILTFEFPLVQRELNKRNVVRCDCVFVVERLHSRSRARNALLHHEATATATRCAHSGCDDVIFPVFVKSFLSWAWRVVWAQN